MKQQKKLGSNINTLKESSKKLIRPNSVFKKELGPIKILNRNQTKIEYDNTSKNKKINDENKDLNTLKESKTKIYINNNNINDNLNFNSLNTNEDFFSENPTQNQLPLLSSNAHTLPNKRAKTAKDRYKLKLENLETMFNIKPTFYYERSKKKLSLKKFGLVPGIPNDLLPRLKLVFSIFKNHSLEDYVEKAPSKMQNTIMPICDYLWEYKTDSKFKELDKYAIFFYYLCTKIQYDIQNINKDEKDLEKIFKSGYANSLQFSKLFEYMCKKHLLRVKHISGFCKSKELPYFKIGTNSNRINHHWNAIYINNKWYFCDLTFGSGGIKPRGEFKKNYFNPFYFLTPPDTLIETHRPIDDLWQLSTKIIPANQFSAKKEILIGEFYKQVYDYGINLVSHDYPIIHFDYCNKPLYIKLGLKEMAIQANLYFHNFRNKISDVKFSFDDKKNIFSLEPIFPENGEYWLEILFREFSSNENQYLPLINYRIIVDDSQEKYFENLKKQKIIQEQKQKLLKELKKNRPKSVRLAFMSGTIIDKKDLINNKKQKCICLDNEGAYLISPPNNNIKIGQENNFKIKVPNSEGVCVLDGRNWNYLKRMKKDKNIWIGKIMINNENILILSMKDNSLYTEVFQLKAQNATSNLLRSGQINREKLKRFKSNFH